MWCIAELDRQYIARMEDVLAIYERPLSAEEPVVCLDEKSVTLRAEVREAIPMKPGRVTRRDYEYKRCGTANAFCAVEPKAGAHYTQITEHRGKSEFAEFLKLLAKQYPGARTIHLVMDNLNTHCRKAVADCFGEEAATALWQRFTVHYTPKHGSWLNQAEIEISLFSRQCLATRLLSSIEMLRQESAAWNADVNQRRVPINWTFDRATARKKFHYRYNITRSQT